MKWNEIKYSLSGEGVSLLYIFIAANASPTVGFELKKYVTNPSVPGMLFMIQEERQTFFEAERLCQEAGMKLGCPANQLQQDFVTSILK